MVIHVRDPRQATLSYIHNLIRNQKEKPILNKMEILPDEYIKWDFASQVDYQIDHRIPFLISWIEGWLDADEDPDFQTKILFTTFEHFKKDKREFINRILDFYQINRDFYNYELIETTPSKGQHLYRQGKKMNGVKSSMLTR